MHASMLERGRCARYIDNPPSEVVLMDPIAVQQLCIHCGERPVHIHKGKPTKVCDVCFLKSLGELLGLDLLASPVQDLRGGLDYDTWREKEDSDDA